MIWRAMPSKAPAEIQARPFVTELQRSTKPSNPPPYSATAPELFPLKYVDTDQALRKNTEASRRHKSPAKADPTSNPRSQNVSKPRTPELNLVTNFSRGPSQRYGQKKSSNVEQNSKKPDQSLSRKSNGSGKGPLDNLRRADSKASDLSPSDRTLVIGMDVPQELKEILDKIDLAVPKDSAPEKNPKTPNIVVTPATKDSLWPTTQRDGLSKRRQRAPSSLYSQMTTMPVTRTSEVPNIPQVPAGYQKKAGNAQRRSRVNSWETEFDEEAMSERSTSRPHSRESQAAMMRKSIDTNGTRPQSKGWWNEVLSPFLARSLTYGTRRSPDDIEPTSPSSKLDYAKCLTRSPEQRKTGQSGSWTDVSRWETPRTGFTDDATRVNRDLGLEAARGQLSPEYKDAGGFGAAAEYFEASWHDQNSPTLFFKCQNHDCASRSRAGRVVNPREPATTFAFPDSTTPKSTTTTTGEDTKNRSRSPSEATEIEDEEVIEEAPKEKPARSKQEAKSLPSKPLALDKPLPEPTPEKSRAIESPKPRAKAVPAEALPVEASPVPSVLPLYSSPKKYLPTKEATFYPTHPRSNLQRGEYLQLNSVESSDYKPARKVQKPPEAPPEPVKEALPPSPYTHQVHHYSAPQNLFPQFKHVPPSFPPPPSQAMKDEKRLREDTSREMGAQGISRLIAADGKPKRPKLSRRKKIYLGICLGLLAMVILIVTLVLTLTIKQSDMPVQSSWVNITGFPPIPTGIATIARPESTFEKTACVQPATMWSCALPKEQQSANVGSDPNQPNMRVEIRFQNGTASSNQTSKRSLPAGNAVSAGQFVRHQLLRIRDTFTDGLFTPNPSPPSQEDQAFSWKYHRWQFSTFFWRADAFLHELSFVYFTRSRQAAVGCLSQHHRRHSTTKS